MLLPCQQTKQPRATDHAQWIKDHSFLHTIVHQSMAETTSVDRGVTRKDLEAATSAKASIIAFVLEDMLRDGVATASASGRYFLAFQ